MPFLGRETGLSLYTIAVDWFSLLCAFCYSVNPRLFAETLFYFHCLSAIVPVKLARLLPLNESRELDDLGLNTFSLGGVKVNKMLLYTLFKLNIIHSVLHSVYTVH